MFVRRLGLVPYEPIWHAMRRFTEQRQTDTPDELWLLQHPPVFTLGQAADRMHVLNPGGIPVVQIDRGGQVTYHGPGQLVVYPLLDLRRRKLGPRDIVSVLEDAMIATVAHYGIAAKAKPDAPGVYVDDAKIGSIGLRIRQTGCYHGLALNVAMDLGPFGLINPCGYTGLQMTQVADFDPAATPASVMNHLSQELMARLA